MCTADAYADSPRDGLDELLGRFRVGDDQARNELVLRTYNRLTHLARRMLNDFPGLRREVETGDVLHSAMPALMKALDDVHPGSGVHFLRLGARCIRRHLLDLRRHYYGPFGIAANRDTVGRPHDDAGGALHVSSPESDGPRSLGEWEDFHKAVEALPDEVRAVVDLHWYQEMTQAEVAAVLGVDVRTVKRRWRAARISLAKVLVETGSH
jgi:RNA polymerase sigma factor (sigma-70 family)